MSKSLYSLPSSDQINYEQRYRLEQIYRIAERHGVINDIILASDIDTPLSRWSQKDIERALEKCAAIVQRSLGLSLVDEKQKNSNVSDDLMSWLYSIAQHSAIDESLYRRIHALYVSTILLNNSGADFREFLILVCQYTRESRRENIERKRLVICYAQRDRRWLERLKVHLAPLQMRNIIDLWDNTFVRPGDLWREEVERALITARAVLVLVSADLLASESIINNELPAILHRHEQAGAKVLPLILSPCLFNTSAMEPFKSINSPDEPLVSLKRCAREALLLKTAETIAGMFG